MRRKTIDFAKRGVEIAAKTHGAIVDEHVRGRLAIGDGRDQRLEAVRPNPRPHIRFVARRENDDLVSACAQSFQECPCAATRFIKVIGAFPAGVIIKDTIEIDADDPRLRHGSQCTDAGVELSSAVRR